MWWCHSILSFLVLLSNRICTYRISFVVASSADNFCTWWCHRASFVGIVYGLASVSTSNLAVPMLAHSLANLIAASLWRLNGIDNTKDTWSSCLRIFVILRKWLTNGRIIEVYHRNSLCIKKWYCIVMYWECSRYKGTKSAVVFWGLLLLTFERI